MVNEVTQEKKVAVLITTFDTVVYTTLNDLCHPTALHQKTFQQLCKMLENQYGRRPISDERWNFYNVKQELNESVKTRLEATIKDRFVSGLLKGKVLNGVAEEDPEAKTLDQIFQVAIQKTSSVNTANIYQQ